MTPAELAQVDLVIAVVAFTCFSAAGFLAITCLFQRKTIKQLRDDVQEARQALQDERLWQRELAEAQKEFADWQEPKKLSPDALPAGDGWEVPVGELWKIWPDAPSFGEGEQR